MTRLRLIVADDSPHFVRKFISVLQVEFDVVATAADGRTALDLVRRHKPDLVVLDLFMPGLSGIEITRELAKNSPSLPVVICSMETDPEIVEAARQVGAAEYVFKAQVDRDLIMAVKSAVQNSTSEVARSYCASTGTGHLSPTQRGCEPPSRARFTRLLLRT